MSSHKNPDNPFAALNASLFPTDRSGRAPRAEYGPQRRAKTPPAPSAPVHEDAGSDVDPDAALFLDAMRSTAPLPQSARKDEHNRTRKGAGLLRPTSATLKKNSPAPVPASPERPAASPEPSGMSGRDAKIGNNLPADQADLSGTMDQTMDPDEERRSFFRAVTDVTPLAGKGRDIAPECPATASPPPPSAEESNPLRDLVEGRVEFTLSATDEFVEGHVLGLDLLTVGKLQARQYSPEVHIDLHGLNSEQAFQSLVNFFRSAYHKGVRTTLVVTGRGLNSPNGTPVLRSKVTQWFTQEPFRRVILAFCTAKREDGGPGALYVMLRKRRKNSGKVRWDALPADPDLFL